jgi:hypothetical protein
MARIVAGCASLQSGASPDTVDVTVREAVAELLAAYEQDQTAEELLLTAEEILREPFYVDVSDTQAGDWPCAERYAAEAERVRVAVQRHDDVL